MLVTRKWAKEYCHRDLGTIQRAIQRGELKVVPHPTIARRTLLDTADLQAKGWLPASWKEGDMPPPSPQAQIAQRQEDMQTALRAIRATLDETRTELREVLTLNTTMYTELSARLTRLEALVAGQVEQSRPPQRCPPA